MLDIVVTDGLSLDNGIARLRVLIAAAVAAGRLLETAEIEARLEALETAIGHGHGRGASGDRSSLDGSSRRDP